MEKKINVPDFTKHIDELFEKHNQSKIKSRNDLFGIHGASFYKCLIAVTFDGSAFLIKAKNNFEEAFDGSDLEDNLTDKKKLPEEPGIYRCVIKYHSFKCNRPDDPEEWDCNVTIESCELVNIPY